MANILIVDDSVVSTQFLEDVLRREGHTVTIAHDSKNIMALIEQKRIGIVLLDVIMPDIDGYELLELLQNTKKTSGIPVIMVTGLTSSQEVKRALECGAMDFVRKTCEPIEIIARINSALRFKRQQDEIIRNSQRDHLTQVYNRQYLNYTLDQFIRERQRYHKGIGLILIDCDYFKRINDRFGHAAGDTVLMAVANATSKSVKQRDVVCRYGGEEFCVLLPNTTEFQANFIAERIRKNIKKIAFIFKGESVVMTVSCGIGYISPHDDKTDIDLINEADAAMYEAKRRGRDQTVVFNTELPST